MLVVEASGSQTHSQVVKLSTVQDSSSAMAGHRLFNEDAFRAGGPCSTRSLAPKRLRRDCWSLRAAKLNEHVSQSVLVKSPI